MNRILLLALVVVGCFFSSCDGSVRISEAQAKQLAQAKADVEAARQTSDLEARNALYAAAGARLMAGLHDVDLPPPITPASKLVAPDGTPTIEVPEEVKKSQAAEEDPPSGDSTWAWVGAGGLALLGLLKFTPGVGGMVANLAYSYFAPKVDRDVDRKAHQLYQHGAAVVQYGVEMANVAKAVDPVKYEAIQDKMVKLQYKLGVKDTVEQLVIAAKASANAPRPGSVIPTSPDQPFPD